MQESFPRRVKEAAQSVRGFPVPPAEVRMARAMAAGILDRICR